MSGYTHIILDGDEFLGSRKVMFSPVVPQAPSYQEGPADPEKTMFQYKH